MPRLEIIEQQFITPKGNLLGGVELVTNCPMLNCKVNVRKNCSKCMAREKISYKEEYVDCKYEKK